MTERNAVNTTVTLVNGDSCNNRLSAIQDYVVAENQINISLKAVSYSRTVVSVWLLCVTAAGENKMDLLEYLVASTRQAKAAAKKCVCGADRAISKTGKTLSYCLPCFKRKRLERAKVKNG